LFFEKACFYEQPARQIIAALVASLHATIAHQGDCRVSLRISLSGKCVHFMNAWRIREGFFQFQRQRRCTSGSSRVKVSILLIERERA